MPARRSRSHRSALSWQDPKVYGPLIVLIAFIALFFCCVLLVLVISYIIVQLNAAAETSAFPPSPTPTGDQQGRFLDTLWIFDGHNDLMWELRENKGNIPLLSAGIPDLMTDGPKMKQGLLAAQFWSVWVPCSSSSNALTLVMEQVSLAQEVFAQFPSLFFPVANSHDIRSLRKSQQEQTFPSAPTSLPAASLLGMEGAHALLNSTSLLPALYALNVRYITLTHSCSNPFASSSVDEDTAADTGLTAHGKELVAKMNALGMLVDISHVSRKTMHDVLTETKAPVIFSHSSARAVCNVARNVPDDVLLRLPASGGVVMINFWGPFAACSDIGTIDDVVAHFVHIKSLIGAAYLGIGADYDGVPAQPVGLETVAFYPELMRKLWEAGFTYDEMEGIAHENILRVMERAEQVAASLTKLQNV